MSEKRDAFVRLASERTSKAIDRIRQLHHLTNSANYESTPDDWDQICAALENEISRLREAVAATQKAKRALSFQL
jgi:hypothetical protein